MILLSPSIRSFSTFIEVRLCSSWDFSCLSLPISSSFSLICHSFMLTCCLSWFTVESAVMPLNCSLDISSVILSRFLELASFSFMFWSSSWATFICRLVTSTLSVLMVLVIELKLCSSFSSSELRCCSESTCRRSWEISPSSCFTLISLGVGVGAFGVLDELDLCRGSGEEEGLWRIPPPTGLCPPSSRLDSVAYVSWSGRCSEFCGVKPWPWVDDTTTGDRRGSEDPLKATKPSLSWPAVHACLGWRGGVTPPSHWDMVCINMASIVP